MSMYRNVLHCLLQDFWQCLLQDFHIWQPLSFLSEFEDEWPRVCAYARQCACHVHRTELLLYERNFLMSQFVPIKQDLTFANAFLPLHETHMVFFLCFVPQQDHALDHAQVRTGVSWAAGACQGNSIGDCVA